MLELFGLERILGFYKLMFSCEDTEINWKISEQAQDQIHSQPAGQTLLELPVGGTARSQTCDRWPLCN